MNERSLHMTLPTAGEPSAPDSPLDGRLVFLVGSRRSGTNWLQRILQTHPQIVGPSGESFLFSRGVVPLLERFQHSSPGATEVGSLYADRDRIVGAVRHLCDVALGDLLELLGPAERLLERTPEHVRCLDVIGAVYPDARFIHIIRDGRDVVRSLLSMQWGTEEAEVAAEEWRAAVVDGRRHGSGLPHYREVRYESLLDDPEAIVRDLFEWIGVDATPDVVAAALKEASRGFTVDPKQPGIGAGKWRDGLDPVAHAILERIAGDALTELGYVEPADDEGPGATVARSGDGSGSAPRLGRAARPRRGAPWLPRVRRQRDHVDDQLVIRERLHHGNHAMNLLLSALATDPSTTPGSEVTDDVRVEIAGPDTVFDGRGVPALERLRDVLTSDPVLRWERLRTDVLAAVPTTTAVVHYRGPSGEHAVRLVYVAVGKGGRVRRLGYHQIGVAP